MSMTDIVSLGFSFDTSGLKEGGTAFDMLTSKANAASQALERMQALATTAMKNVPSSLGGLTGGGSAGLSATIADHDRLTASVSRTTAALGEATKAHQSHGAAAYKSALALAEVEHVGRSMIDGLASGQGVLRTLFMESGRLQIAFQNGLGGALKEVAEKAVGIINPLTIGTGVLAGLGAAAYLATSRVHELQLEMARATGGAGRFAGLSGEGLSALASSQAADFNMQTRGLGLGDARTAAAALARTGRLDAGNITTVMGLVPGYAGATGSSFGEAGDKLAGIMADPTRGLGELEKVVGALDDRTRQTVISLQTQGDAQGAVRLLVDRTTVAFDEMVQPQSGWSRFVQQFSDRNTRFEADIASVVDGPTPLQRYGWLSRQGASPIGAANIYQRQQGEANDIAEDLRHRAMLSGASPLMRSEGADLLASQQSQAAGDIIRRMLPDLDAHQHLVDQQTSLSKALSNPDTANLLGPAANDARDALDRLNTALSTFKTGLQQLVEQGEFGTRSALARTAAERAAVDIDRAYITTLERTHDGLQANQAAENSRNEAIAASTRTALDALRSTSDRAGLVGLRPFDRVMRENDIRFRDLQERTITGPIASGTAIDVSRGGLATPAMVANAAAQTGLPASLIAALGQVENGGRLTGGTNILDANGRPASSAYGFGQITTGAEADIRKVLAGFDRTNPDTAVLGAATYLKELVDRNHGDVAAALGAYGGPDPNHNGTGNAGYVANIMRRANMGPGGVVDLPVIDVPHGSTTVDTGAATLANRLNYAEGRQADAQSMLFDPLRQARDQTTGQRALFDAQQNVLRQSFGMPGASPAMAAALASATSAQRDWNKVAADGVSLQKLQTTFGAEGTKMWADLTAKIKENAAAAGDLAAHKEEVRRTTEDVDFVRDSSNSLMSAPLLALAHHQNVGAAFDQAMVGIGDRLINKGVGSITDSFFGAKGEAGGGLFGGFLGNLFSGQMFAGGTDFAPAGPAIVGEKGPELINLPRGAQVVPNSALANMRPSSQTVHYRGGDIIVQGDVSEQNRALIEQRVAQGNQQVIEHITRNLPQIQSDAALYT